MKYSFSGRVRYSELGPDGRLTLHSLVNYFQDCCTFQSETIGKGMAYCQKQQRGWVLSAWQIMIGRLPEIGEEVTAVTWPYAFRGFFGSRNFLLTDAAGTQLACANSLWSLLDMQRGVPVKIEPRDREGYELEEKLDMAYAPRKITLPEGLKEEAPIPVRPHHLDTNRHVNNGQYIAMAQELLPEDFPVGQLRVEYKKQARLGEEIIPWTLWEGERYYVVQKDRQGGVYCTVEFEKTQV